LALRGGGGGAAGEGGGDVEGRQASGTGPNAAKMIHQRKRSSSGGGAASKINHKIRSDCLAVNVGEVLTHVGRLHSAERRLLCEIQALGSTVGFEAVGDDVDSSDTESTSADSSQAGSTISEL
jgi:hypothetical protein